MQLVSPFSEPGIKRYGIKHLTAEKEKEKERRRGLTSAVHVLPQFPQRVADDFSLVNAPLDPALAWL